MKSGSEIMDSFQQIADTDQLRADVMRLTCFLVPEVSFKLFSRARQATPELSEVFERCSDTKAAMLDLLRPLEELGLIEIDESDEVYRTTAEILEEIIEKDDTY